MIIDNEIIIYFFYMIIAAYFSARITTMTMYALTWGMLLGGVKEYFAKRINKESYDMALAMSKEMSFQSAMLVFEGDAENEGLYDLTQRESKAFRILCCDYCLGMYVSIIIAIPISILSWSLAPFVVIPILAYHITEKM